MPRELYCVICVWGGGISHDFGLRFNSPTVNLMIPANEFVSLLSDINQVNDEIIKVSTEEKYPVGLLANQYMLHFIHFKTFNEAVSILRKRSRRINKYEPYLILVETASCSYRDIVKFDKLPYKHKIALVHCEYPSVKCAKVIRGFDGKNYHGDILQYTTLWGQRMYDQVDWIGFLNLRK